MPVINGEIYTNNMKISLKKFLNDENYNIDRIAVIINDLINIVNFVQGG